MTPCAQVLESLGLEYDFFITSAHRTPERTKELVVSEEAKGCQVFICAAGMAAHLAGVVASYTMRPVIGIPLASQALGGMDALLSTVQMPSGYPVATVAIGGAKNAAWLAAQIIALNDPDLQEKIKVARREMQQAVISKSLVKK